MVKTTLRSLVPATVLALILASGAFAANFAIDWCVIGSGGGEMASAGFALAGTIGQPVAGFASSSGFALDMGFWQSDAAGSPPVQVDGLDEGKRLSDGTSVAVSGKIATTDAGDFTGFFYVEESDRPSGIRIVPAAMPAGLARGKTVSLTGTMMTASSGERYIGDAVVTVGVEAVTPVTPLGMNNRAIGGGNLGDPAAGLGQYGVQGGSGTNNVGLLVRAWGKVVDSGTGYIVIDDGSGVLVRVDITGVSGVPTSGYVSVTGACSFYGSSPNPTRLILAID